MFRDKNGSQIASRGAKRLRNVATDRVARGIRSPSGTKLPAKTKTLRCLKLFLYAPRANIQTNVKTSTTADRQPFGRS